MNTLRNHGIDESKASKETQLVRRTDYRLMFWISTTQVWSWDGGDAIVVVVGEARESHSVVVLRIGDKVHVVECMGLATAMDAYGLDSKSFQIAA